MSNWFREEDKEVLKDRIMSKLWEDEIIDPEVNGNIMLNVPGMDCSRDLPSGYGPARDNMTGFYNMIAGIAHKVAENMIEQKMKKVIDTLIDEMYTQEDFEKDIGLK